MMGNIKAALEQKKAKLERTLAAVNGALTALAKAPETEEAVRALIAAGLLSAAGLPPMARPPVRIREMPAAEGEKKAE
jgi:hypothetical protein